VHFRSPQTGAVRSVTRPHKHPWFSPSTAGPVLEDLSLPVSVICTSAALKGSQNARGTSTTGRLRKKVRPRKQAPDTGVSGVEENDLARKPETRRGSGDLFSHGQLVQHVSGSEAVEAVDHHLASPTISSALSRVKASYRFETAQGVRLQKSPFCGIRLSHPQPLVGVQDLPVQVGGSTTSCHRS